MNLPNAEKAVIDDRKPREYALNENHADGKHKAFVFKRVLNLTAEDTPVLRNYILDAILYSEAVIRLSDQYGRRYSVDIEIERMGREATIRTGWIIRTGEDFPRLTSCYIKQD